MANNGLVKNYVAEAAVPAFRIVKPGANDFGILVGGAATDKLMGITTEIDALTGERADVVHTGIADLKLGGTVLRGDPITSDATGQGVAAAPAAGVNNRIIAFAVIAGGSGDIIPVLLAPGSVQG